MDIGFFQKKAYQDTVETVVYTRFACNEVAKIATELTRHFGIVAAEPDGEDSSGRQRLKLLAPVDVANRACDVAQELWEQFKVRGLLLEIPAPYIPEKKKETKTV